MSLLDVSIVAVALPSMGEGLGASPAAIQWVVSGYALTFGLALVPAGRPGDAFGRRTMFLAALTGSWCAALPRERRRASACSSRPVSCRGRGRGVGSAELGADPAAVPRRGARTRLRLLRCHGRDLHRGGTGGRRADPGAGRRSGRMALDLLRQRAHRARRARARSPPATPGNTREAGIRRRSRGRAARRRSPGPDAAARAGGVGRTVAAVVVVPGRNRAARRLRMVGAAGRAPRR